MKLLQIAKLPRARVDYHRKQTGGTMNAKNPCCGFTFCYRPVRRAGRDPSANLGPRLMSLRPSQTWKMMASKPIWPATQAFYQKALAEDWTRGDSDGTFTPKPNS